MNTVLLNNGGVMKTLKVGALALSVMVAGSALAYPGQQYVAALVAGVKALPAGYETKVRAFGQYLLDKGYNKTAAVVRIALLTHAKKTAAGATVGVVGVVAYKQYKNYKAKQARMARQLARQAKAEQTAEEVTLG